MMEDIYLYLFSNWLSITAQRAFVCVSKQTSKLMVHMQLSDFETRMTKDWTNFVEKGYYSKIYDPMYRHTMSLIYDDCTHLLPDSYIVPENIILFKNSICKQLGKNGDLKMIKRLVRSGLVSSVNIQKIISGACYVGNRLILKWLKKQGYHFSREAPAWAAAGNQKDMLIWLIEEYDMIIPYSAIRSAARENHSDMVRFLITEKNCDSTYGGYPSALNGNLDIVKFLFEKVSENFREQFLTGVRDGAIYGNQLKILRFAYDQGYNFSPPYYIPCSNVDVLHWLVDNKHITLDRDMFLTITFVGDYECFKYVNNKIAVDAEIFANAISGAHEEIIQHIIDQGHMQNHIVTWMINCPFLPNGRALSVLKHINVSCWSGQVLEAAARNGNLSVLKYAYENNFIIHNDIVMVAAIWGHLNVVIWSCERISEWCSEFTSAVAHSGDVNILKWLRNIDNYRSVCSLTSKETRICSWDEELCLAAIKRRQFVILKFAIENGCDYGARTIDAAKYCQNEKIKNYINNLTKKMNN